MECVLVSGGVDSSVLLWEVSQESGVLPVYVSCGLGWEEAELRHLKRFMSDIGLGEPRVLDVPIGDLYGDHWSVSMEGVPGRESDDIMVELPGRNILLLSKAAVLCSLLGVNTIHHGTLGSNPFPDATPSFFSSAEQMLSRGLDHDISVSTPYTDRSKQEIIKAAVSHDLPLGSTFSCIKPVDGDHCGECNKCAERHREFREAGVVDPTNYVNQFRS